MHHLILDGTGAAITKAQVERFLAELPPAIGMHPLAPPLIVQAHDGVTGVVVISESHISVHTFDDGRFYVDVFSCKEFFTLTVSRLLSELCGPYHASGIKRVCR